MDLLRPIIDEEKPDCIILVGGLFSSRNSTKKNSTKTEFEYNTENKILELNWFLIPVLIIPDELDTLHKKGIKRLQNQDMIWIRWINDKGTLLDGWLIAGMGGLADNIKISEDLIKYNQLAKDRVIAIISATKKIQLNESGIPYLIITDI